jgi:hypothetical protein
LDDAAGTAYSAYNSNTTDGTYALAFYCVAAAFSALAYGVCIITSMASIYIHPKLTYHLNILVFFCQFTIAVLISIDASKNISPSSSHATAVQTESMSLFIQRTTLTPTGLDCLMQ